MSTPAPLTEDAINRFRIIHPTDKETRPLARRLHRYATATSLDLDPETGSLEHEREMIRLESLKWKLGIERMVGSVRNLERQRSTYQARVSETVHKTESLRKTLEEEQGLLETRRRERDRMIKCDEIAAKISARGKNRQELDERITTLRQSLEEHKAALKLYQETAQGRIDIFTQITNLVKDCRDLKLPIDPNATIPVEEDPEKMDVDEKGPSTSTSTSTGNITSGGTKLSSMSLPFQPTIGGSSSTTTGSGSGSGSQRPGPKSRSSTPPASAALPARPPTGPSSTSASGSGSASRTSASSRAPPGASSLPSRPSNLRSSTTGRMAGTSGGSLEEGELGGDEDGELKDRGVKRGPEPDRTSGRSTRSRK